MEPNIHTLVIKCPRLEVKHSPAGGTLSTHWGSYIYPLGFKCSSTKAKYSPLRGQTFTHWWSIIYSLEFKYSPTGGQISTHWEINVQPLGVQYPHTERPQRVLKKVRPKKPEKFSTQKVLIYFLLEQCGIPSSDIFYERHQTA